LIDFFSRALSLHLPSGFSFDIGLEFRGTYVVREVACTCVCGDWDSVVLQVTSFDWNLDLLRRFSWTVFYGDFWGLWCVDWEKTDFEGNCMQLRIWMIKSCFVESGRY
jgi:hypothetical protein